MTPFPAAFLVALVVTAIAQMVLPDGRQLPSDDESSWEFTRVGMGLWAGLVVSTVIVSFLMPRLPAGEDLQMGPGLWPVALAFIPLFATSLVSDYARPRSERHALGLLLAGVFLFFAGFGIDILTNPLKGTVGLTPLVAVVLSTIWLFVLASIVELVSLVPLGVVMFGLALSGVIWLSGGEQQTVASYSLAGLVAGAIVGRQAGSAILRRPRPMGKTEVFALGFWLTALTNISFLKGVAFAGFVLPLGGLTVAIIVICIRAFERTLLLRETPRA